VLARDPRNATGHQWHGDNLAELGRMDEAAREARLAVDLDPLSAVALNDLTYILLSSGKFAEAIVAGHRALELDITYSFVNQYLGLAYAFINKPDSAVAGLDRFFREDSTAPGARADNVWRFALVGQWAEAEQQLAAINRTNVAGGSRDFDLFIANIALGNKPAALDALERGVRDDRFIFSSSILGCDPTFASLKTEPRLLAVIKELGQGICAGSVKWPIPTRSK
jgi:tetratricopeptide (TPR) repeat protein